MHKKGQLSYEYILVVGMVFTLLIPFFYSFSVGLTGGIGQSTTEGALHRMAQATKTIAHLGGEGSTMRVPAKLVRVKEGSEAIQYNRIAFTAGQKYSIQTGVPRLASGQNVFEEGGMQYVKVQMGPLDTVIVGDAPTIIAACPKDVPIPNHEECYSNNLHIKPQDGFYLIGGNFPKGKVQVFGVKESNQVPVFNENEACGDTGYGCFSDAECPTNPNPQYCTATCRCEPTLCGTPQEECREDSACGGAGDAACIIDECRCADMEPKIEDNINENILKLETDKTGKGTYLFVVTDSEGRQSKEITIVVDAKKGKGGDDDDEEDGDD
tara:strand:- start:55568 stop:56542 length:975 start_codon:yes stop_codon:yes gene_type:complete